MTKRGCAWALGALLALWGAGCGGGASCQSICERNESLGCGTATCVSTCEDGRRVAQEVGCGGQWGRLADCSEESACTDITMTCRDAYASAIGCVTEYCIRNPTDTRCP